MQKAKIIIECDAFGNIEIYSNLAERDQQLEVMRLALQVHSKKEIKVRLFDGQKKPYQPGSILRN